MKLFLCGDVMTGRGIDQIMPHAGDPVLHEAYVRSARDYVLLAEQRFGPISRPVSFDYVWGDALTVLEEKSPELRIINLETSITADGTPEAKGIHYRMHPKNLGCIATANIDCCVLANNHVADWGIAGLTDTIASLNGAGIKSAGAGAHKQAAGQPAILRNERGERALIFAFACPSAGVPAHWAAGADRPGVNFLPDLGEEATTSAIDAIGRWRLVGDLVVASIHWGPNWGYDIPEEHRRFAHRLVDEAGVDLVHGHSSHHPMGIEIHRRRPILYGCGDFLNDYEGIGGYEAFKPDLALAYFPEFADRDHRLEALKIVPFQLRNLRLRHASHADAAWLAAMLDRESRPFGHRVRLFDDGIMTLQP